jgi:hypothetical protein
MQSAQCTFVTRSGFGILPDQPLDPQRNRVMPGHPFVDCAFRHAISGAFPEEASADATRTIY